MNKEDKFVVTIGRQFGSGGHVIGKKLAERLGVQFYDKELLLEAAKELGLNPNILQKTDEKLPPFYVGNLSLTLGFYMQPFSSPATSYYDNVQKSLCDTIKAVAARESCVIVGRCADYLLRDNPRCFNVFISASPQACAKRIVERTEGISLDDALVQAKKENKLRAEYYNFYTDKEWGHSSSYDLCIDSSRLGIDDSIEIIVYSLQRRLSNL